MKLTEWFDPCVTPWEPGIYQTQEPDGSIFHNYWNGENWHYGNYACITPRYLIELPARCLVKWRGLAEKP